MALVNVCPKTELDVIQASKRLGCGNDTYGNNQYMCVPNKEKTSLVEFCFQGVMGIAEKGWLKCKKEIYIFLLIVVNKVITKKSLI